MSDIKQQVLLYMNNSKSVQSYLKTTSFNIDDFEEIGDGNVNFIYRINPKGCNKTIIIKCAKPFVKISPNQPLTEKRLMIEYEMLSKLNVIHKQSCPLLVEYSPEYNCFAFEDLKMYRKLRHDLMDGIVNFKVVNHLTKILAEFHDATHCSNLSLDEVKSTDEKFKNIEMANLSNKYIFTEPFLENGVSNKIDKEVKPIAEKMWKNTKLLNAAEEMKKIFNEKKECLIHGDLHTESVLVCGEDVKIIDGEFAMVGPASFDIGMLIANYIFSYYNHMLCEVDNDAHRKFAYDSWQAIDKMLNKYEVDRRYPEDDRVIYFEKFWSEVAGMCGCELIRRTVGIAHVADIEKNPLAEKECLESGIRLLERHGSIKESHRILLIALMLTY